LSQSLPNTFVRFESLRTVGILLQKIPQRRLGSEGYQSKQWGSSSNSTQ